MIVWRVTGSNIGPDGNGAAHFPTKAEAVARLREYGADSLAIPRAGHGPEKVIVNSRDDLARALDDAMGYGVT